MPYAKNHINVNVQRRSGFDKRHRNSGTLTCGTLTPILCDEVIPNSRVSLKLNLATQLPPLASDTYMNLKLRVEAFFVPMRLLCGSFENFFCDFPKLVSFRSDTSILELKEAPAVIPHIPIGDLSDDDITLLSSPGSLADYLGIRVDDISDVSFLNPLPFAAYHLCYQEWYRNPRVQKPAFVPPYVVGPAATEDPSSHAYSLPYSYYSSLTGASSPVDYARDFVLHAELADGVSLFGLRQRNFGLDYFTGARVSAQQGPAVSLSVPGTIEGVADENDDVTGTSNSSFTIAALRAANSLQQFRERNNLPSPRLVDQVSARYGANLSDGIAQRPICIGSASYDVDVNGISQTAPGAQTGADTNPFSGVASQYGRAFGAGSDFIISDFVANEPGYILVNISLVPEVTYSSGVAPMFRRYMKPGSITDMACSLLQNTGDQPIYSSELNDVPYDTENDVVFGYTDRYADFMFIPNSCHGKFRDHQSLESFVLTRHFHSVTQADMPVLSDSFLQIPKTYLDQVMAVSTEVSGVSAWYDCMLDYHVSMPLAEYSIPSLQDPAYEHGKTVSLRRNGQIF